MSIAALNWVFRMHPGWLDGVTRSVLVILADHADESDSCWPAIETIMRRSSWSERAVRKALRKLQAQGMIAARFRPNKPTRYTLHLALDRSGPPPCSMEAAPDADAQARIMPISEMSFVQQPSSERDGPLSIEAAPGAPLVQADAPRGAPGAGPGGTSCPSRGAPGAPNPPENHQRTTRGGRRRARAMPLSLDWQPSEAEAEYALRRGLDPQMVADRFRRYHFATGQVWIDWSLRWQCWCDGDVARREAGAARPAPRPSAAFRPVPTAAEEQALRVQRWLARWQAKRAAGESTLATERVMQSTCPEAWAALQRQQAVAAPPAATEPRFPPDHFRPPRPAGEKNLSGTHGAVYRLAVP